MERPGRALSGRMACSRLGLPTMRQEVIDATGRLSRQSLQHILQVTVRVEPVELSGLYEAHDYYGALPRIWAGGCWRDAKGVSASHVRVDAPDNRGGRRATRNQLRAGAGAGRGDTPCARVSACDQISSIPDSAFGSKIRLNSITYGSPGWTRMSIQAADSKGSLRSPSRVTPKAIPEIVGCGETL